MRQVCGLDVHKDTIFACIMDNSGVIFQEKFGTLTSELERLASDLEAHDVSLVGMESTSVYWRPVWKRLSSVCEQKLVNPYFIKQLPGKKSDVKDAEWIATCLGKDLIRGSYVPEERIQQLRLYDRRVHDLNHEIVTKLNRLDAALQRCNIRISNYVSSIDGKAYKEIVDLIAQGKTSPEVLAEKVHGRTLNKHGRDVIIDSLTGTLSLVDIDVIAMYKAELDLARKHKDLCLRQMEKICTTDFKEQYDNLTTIPGIKGPSACAIIAELGVDMSAFPSSAHLISWAGLKPRNDESAGKIKSRRITHGNKYLRKTLIECAWAAGRTRDCHFSKFSYHQTVVRKKNKMKVQVAIARKLLTAIWFVLSTGKPYKDYQKKEVKQEDSNS